MLIDAFMFAIKLLRFKNRRITLACKRASRSVVIMGDITFNGFKMALLENSENEGTRMFTLFNAPESLARQ